MDKPEVLLPRIIREGDAGPFCPRCGSSLALVWLFFRTSKCVNQECRNFAKKKT